MNEPERNRIVQAIEQGVVRLVLALGSSIGGGISPEASDACCMLPATYFKGGSSCAVASRA